MKQVFSNHIGGSSELLVLADIKPGFVPIRTPVSYAARLRRHLKLVDALRRGGLETDRAGTYVGPIDSLRSLQFIQWTLIDNDTRMLLSVNYDQPFEPYMRRIVDVSGPLLDSVFCHCVGFDGRSSDNGFHKFMEFIEENQVPVDLFAAAAPDVSVDDADYLLEMDTALRGTDSFDLAGGDPLMWIAEHRMTLPIEKLLKSAATKPDQLLDQSFGVLRAMFSNVPYFPPFPPVEGATTDDVIYYNLVRTLMPGFWPMLIRRAPGLTPQQKLELIQTHNPSDPSDAYRAVVGASDPEQDALLDHLIKTYALPLGWYGQKPRGQSGAQPHPPRQHGEIQAGLLKKLDKASHACLLLFRVDEAEAGRKFLSQMDQHLWPDCDTNTVYNLSVTRNGLRAIGMHEGRLAAFPRDFREGMEGRAGLLGDIDVNHPSNWVWPKGNWPLNGDDRRVAPATVDIVVTLTTFGHDLEGCHIFDENHPLFAEIEKLASEAPDGIVLTAVEPMQRKYFKDHPDRVAGHLGFADGISQPRFDGQREYTAAPHPPHPVGKPEIAQAGDILIGNQAKLDQPGLYSLPGQPLLDGTFQVVRKIRLDVARFHQAAEDASTPEVSGQEIAEKMMGRRMDGTTLTKGAPDDQDFNHAEDPHGRQTPRQSHVRRTNPREFDTPRILRRGFSYGPYLNDEDGSAQEDRGMVFIAYNASIAQQFEIIQRWVSGGNSTGLASGHGDPLLAPVRPGGSRNFRFTVDGEQGPNLIHVPLPDKPFGVLQWGVYAFTPARAGLRALADASITAAPDDLPKAPPAAVPQTRDAWQLLLEDTDANRRIERANVWGQINAQGGAIRTDYGVIATSADAVRQVMVNADQALSAQPYLERMQKSVGEQYLGYDLTPEAIKDGRDHSKESWTIWDFLNTRLDGQTAFDMAFKLTRAHINALPEEVKPTKGGKLDGERIGRSAHMLLLINDVAAGMCRDLFGLKGAEIQFGGMEQPGAPVPHCPGDILNAAAHIFGPYPHAGLQMLGQGRGQLALSAFKKHVSAGANGDAGTLLKHLRDIAKKDSYWSDDKIATSLAGVTMGLVAPVMGSFVATLFDWIISQSLWRHQQWLQEAAPQTSDDMLRFAMNRLRPEILASMTRRAAPDLIQRTAVKPTRIGDCDVQPGERVIGSIAAAVTDRPDQALFYLFGGVYGADKSGGDVSEHSCPGRSVGLNTLMGAICALMSSGKIEPFSPISVRIKTGER